MGSCGSKGHEGTNAAKLLVAKKAVTSIEISGSPVTTAPIGSSMSANPFAQRRERTPSQQVPASTVGSALFPGAMRSTVVSTNQFDNTRSGANHSNSAVPAKGILLNDSSGGSATRRRGGGNATPLRRKRSQGNISLDNDSGVPQAHEMLVLAAVEGSDSRLLGVRRDATPLEDWARVKDTTPASYRPADDHTSLPVLLSEDAPPMRLLMVADVADRRQGAPAPEDCLMCSSNADDLVDETADDDVVSISKRSTASRGSAVSFSERVTVLTKQEVKSDEEDFRFSAGTRQKRSFIAMRECAESSQLQSASIGEDDALQCAGSMGSSRSANEATRVLLSGGIPYSAQRAKPLRKRSITRR